MRQVWMIASLTLLLAPFGSDVRAQSARGSNVPASGDARLAERLRTTLDDPPFDRALWGIAIMDPSGRIVFERNGDRLFVPASNVKIVISAVATSLLPPTWRFRTSAYAAGAIHDGTLDGDLVLFGRGDPSLSDRFYPTRLTAFEDMADSIRARGVTRITGDVIGDASFFDSLTIHPSWESYDLSWWYAAPVSALAFNDNSVDFLIAPTSPGAPASITFEPDLGLVQFTNRTRTVPVDSPRTIDFHRLQGSNVVWADGDVPVDARAWTENVSLQDGALYAATAFRQALQNRGITVGGRARATYDPAACATARLGEPLAEHDSPPLPQLVEPILKISHNWYAEMLLKALAREETGTGSWDSGVAVERRFLRDSLGVDTTQFSLADGSGLSHWNLVTPRAFVQILHAMRRHPSGAAFRSALPVSGGEGTLRFRSRGAGLTGRVHAKTGSIANVNTLSGYLESRAGPWTFSIQINNHTAENREALRRIDAVVAAIPR
jgi:D-alanyl-D-alanine carboxypeptidase/D-alanyl-D-alanine-endopeptidase (penicillin-binding protein 4)